MTISNVSCQVCGQGVLKKKTKFRMSGPVVVIGFLLLVPSILGMLFGILIMFATGGVADESKTGLETRVREELQTAGISGQIAEKVVSGKHITESDRASLTTEQSVALNDAKLTYGAGKVGAGAGTFLAGGLAVAIVIFSLIGGLIGWLLVMRKKVLQCGSCRAIVAAS